MATTYIWDINPIQDILMKMLLSNVDISLGEEKQEIYNIFTYLLENFLKNKNDLIYLDFDIKKRKNFYKLIPNNLLSGLWFLGYFPDNPNQIIQKNEFTFDNKKYSFNNKTKILKCSSK